jgi:hypothetical protein
MDKRKQERKHNELLWMPICEAVKIVMGNENQIGREVRGNYDKMINFFFSTGN